MKLIKIMLKIKCKMGLHDPRVYAYTEGKENVKMELYYTCLYCPYGFWDYLVNPPEEDMDNLSEYKFSKKNKQLCDGIGYNNNKILGICDLEEGHEEEHSQEGIEFMRNEK